MKKNKIILIGAAALILITAAITAAISLNKKKPVERTEFMLDTICKVTLHDWQGNADDIMDGVFDLCADYEQLLSPTISTSDIYRINHSHGNPTTVSSPTAKLISDALEYCRISNGAFDITILPIKELWDLPQSMASGNLNIPNDKDLADTLALVDYSKVTIDGNTVTIPEGMGIDLGAIAKGFIADEMANYLRGRNVTSALISLGGNIYAIGSKPDGLDWRIGIQEPFSENQSDVIEISNASAVTSGVYQRYMIKDDKLYHHIFDAKIGLPCDTGLYSVTIISDNSEQCDALATVCMLVGYEKSMEILQNYPNVKAIFITSKNELLYSYQ